MNERRQSVRVQCHLPALLKNIDSNSLQPIDNALVMNISRSGICVRLDQFIPVQSRLYVYLNLPDHPPIEVRTAPAWISELPHLEKYEMGGRFVGIRPEDENAIQSFQYKTLLEKIPQRTTALKDFQKNEPKPSAQ